MHLFKYRFTVANGSFVEVQQDTEHNFEATFVECTGGHHRPPCHGIDTVIYSSECVTMYEWRRAFVRLPGSNVNFIASLIKVCQKCWTIFQRTVSNNHQTLFQYIYIYVLTKCPCFADAKLV
uniref:Integrase_H2C2 domain-containing protein n=1 Tax=Angiostrongylus cantonensis TaxID=6313 RepID=A0A0K0DFF1_ANGCA